MNKRIDKAGDATGKDRGMKNNTTRYKRIGQLLAVVVVISAVAALTLSSLTSAFASGGTPNANGTKLDMTFMSSNLGMSASSYVEHPPIPVAAQHPDAPGAINYDTTRPLLFDLVITDNEPASGVRTIQFDKPLNSTVVARSDANWTTFVASMTGNTAASTRVTITLRNSANQTFNIGWTLNFGLGTTLTETHTFQPAFYVDSAQVAQSNATSFYTDTRLEMFSGVVTSSHTGNLNSFDPNFMTNLPSFQQPPATARAKVGLEYQMRPRAFNFAPGSTPFGVPSTGIGGNGQNLTSLNFTFILPIEATLVSYDPAVYDVTTLGDGRIMLTVKSGIMGLLTNQYTWSRVGSANGLNSPITVSYDRIPDNGETFYNYESRIWGTRFDGTTFDSTNPSSKHNFDPDPLTVSLATGTGLSAASYQGSPDYLSNNDANWIMSLNPASPIMIGDTVNHAYSVRNTGEAALEDVTISIPFNGNIWDIDDFMLGSKTLPGSLLNYLDTMTFVYSDDSTFSVDFDDPAYFNQSQFTQTAVRGTAVDMGTWYMNGNTDPIYVKRIDITLSGLPSAATGFQGFYFGIKATVRDTKVTGEAVVPGTDIARADITFAATSAYDSVTTRSANANVTRAISAREALTIRQPMSTIIGAVPSPTPVGNTVNISGALRFTSSPMPIHPTNVVEEPTIYLVVPQGFPITFTSLQIGSGTFGGTGFPPDVTTLPDSDYTYLGMTPRPDQNVDVYAWRYNGNLSWPDAWGIRVNAQMTIPLGASAASAVTYRTFLTDKNNAQWSATSISGTVVDFLDLSNTGSTTDFIYGGQTSFTLSPVVILSPGFGSNGDLDGTTYRNGDLNSVTDAQLSRVQDSGTLRFRIFNSTGFPTPAGTGTTYVIPPAGDFTPELTGIEVRRTTLSTSAVTDITLASNIYYTTDVAAQEASSWTLFNPANPGASAGATAFLVEHGQTLAGTITDIVFGYDIPANATHNQMARAFAYTDTTGPGVKTPINYVGFRVVRPAVTVNYYKDSVGVSNLYATSTVASTYNTPWTIPAGTNARQLSYQLPAGYENPVQQGAIPRIMQDFLPGTADPNVINVVADKRTDLTYVIEYYTGTTLLTATKIGDSLPIGPFTTGDSIPASAITALLLDAQKPAVGYNSGVIQTTMPYTMTGADDVIKVLYTPLNNLTGSISYYRDAVGLPGLIATDALSNLVFGSTYTPTQAQIDEHKPTGYVGTITPTSRTIGMSGNTFEVLYLPTTNNTATVRYWKDSVGVGNQLGSDVSLTGLTFGVRYDALGIDVDLLRPTGYQAGVIQSPATTITTVGANNIIDIVYSPRDDLTYIIKYYQDTFDALGYMAGNDSTAQGPVTFGTRVLLSIAQLNAHKPFGYQTGIQQGDALGYLIQVTDNVISVLYLPEGAVPYTVRYYKGSVSPANEIAGTMVTSTAVFGSTVTVTDMAAKQPAGYGPGTQSSGLISSMTENIINVIYPPLSNNNVDVGYYMEGLVAGTYSLIATDTITGFTTDAALVLPASGVGSVNHRQPANFAAGVIQPGSDSVVKPGTSHVIVHYDRPRNLAGSISYYKDTVDIAGFIQTDGLTNLVLGATYTPTQLLIDAHKPTGYVGTITPASKTIAMSGNTFEVLYLPSTNNTATVRYWKDSVGVGNQLGADVALTGLTFGVRYDALGIDVNLRQPTGYQAGIIQSATNTIGIVAANNIIDIIYLPRTDLEYTIRYYKDTLDLAGYMIGQDVGPVGPVTFGSRVLLNIAQLDAKKPYGYQSGIQQGDASGYLIQVSGNVISVLYLPIESVPYTVRYYKGSVAIANEIPNTSVEATGTFGATIAVTDMAAKQPAGYGPGTQSSGLLSSTTENIINVIYQPLSNNNVAVGYYMEDVTAGQYSLIATDTISGFTTDTALVLPASGIGSLNNRQPADFTAGVIQAGSDTIVQPGTSHVIIHYDRPRNLAGSITYYRDTQDASGLIQTDNLSSLVLGATYAPTQALIDAHKPTGYVATITPTSRTVAMTGNDFVVLYMPSTDNTATVRYYKDSVGVGNQLGADVSLTGLTFGIRYDGLGIDVNLRQPEGYQAGTIQSPATTITTVGTSNIINIVYLPRTDLEYIIKYYKDSVDASGYMEGNDSSTQGPVTFGTRVLLTQVQLDAHQPYGYQSGRQQGDILGHLVQVTGNVISVLYIAENDIPYTVRYYKNSVAALNEIPNTSVEATTTFGATITVTDMATKQPAGYGPGTQSSGLIASMTENIINVVYQALSNNSVEVGYYAEDITAGSYSLIATDTISGFTTDTALVLPASGTGSLNNRQPADFATGVIQAQSDSIVKPGTSHVVIHYARPRNLTATVDYYKMTIPASSSLIAPMNAPELLGSVTLENLILGDTISLEPGTAPGQIDYMRQTGWGPGVADPASLVVAASGNTFSITYTYQEPSIPPRQDMYTIVYHPGTTDTVHNLPLGGTYYSGRRVTVETAPTRIGYRLAGYRIEVTSARDAAKFTAGTYQPFATFTMPEANLKATALWQKVWPATFHPEGGSSVPGQTVDDGATIAVPTPPTREGYEFMGWYTRDGVLYDFSQPMEGPVELFAGWRKATTGSSPKTGDTLAASGIIAVLAAGVGVFVISRYWKRERTESI